MSEWKPIETAPKNGSWLLLKGGKTNEIDEPDTAMKGRPVVAQYANYVNGTELKEGRWQFAWYDGGYYGIYDKPTHWMPLP